MATKLPTPPDYTDAELLAHCKAAIAEVLQFQSSTFRGKTVTRADLAGMRALKKELEADIATAGRTSGAMVGYSRHGRC
jgi:hypothetical protein